MIQYLYKDGEEACTREPLRVRQDGKIIGEIRKVDSGFQYFPKGSKSGGDILHSVTAVQRSLSDEI